MWKFLVFLLVSFSIGVNAQSMKVITYNIRYDNPQDGENAWPKRKQNVFALLKKQDPDVFGVQEALHHQLADITTQLDGYTYVGVGRDDGKQKGEYSAIFFKRERFELLEQNTFWLSETPDVAGSVSWDAAITRIATWAMLLDKKYNRKFLFVNTHFDHKGVEARKQSAELLKTKIADLAQDIPSILSGDFNCTPNEPPYQILTNGGLIELIDHSSQPAGTFCGFAVDSIPCKTIDYIFTTNEWRADKYTVIQDNDGKYYPSDHLPVMVTLSLTE